MIGKSSVIAMSYDAGPYDLARACRACVPTCMTSCSSFGDFEISLMFLVSINSYNLI